MNGRDDLGGVLARLHDAPVGATTLRLDVVSGTAAGHGDPLLGAAASAAPAGRSRPAPLGAPEAPIRATVWWHRDGRWRVGLGPGTTVVHDGVRVWHRLGETTRWEPAADTVVAPVASELLSPWPLVASVAFVGVERAEVARRAAWHVRTRLRPPGADWVGPPRLTGSPVELDVDEGTGVLLRLVRRTVDRRWNATEVVRLDVDGVDERAFRFTPRAGERVVEPDPAPRPGAWSVPPSLRGSFPPFSVGGPAAPGQVPARGRPVGPPPPRPGSPPR